MNTPVYFSFGHSFPLRITVVCYLCKDARDTQWLSTLAIPKLSILAGLPFLFHAAGRSAEDHYFGSMCLERVRGGILFRSSTSQSNVLRYFGVYRNDEENRMQSLLAVL